MMDASTSSPDTWLSIRLFSPQALGATVAPLGPALAAAWQGQNIGLTLLNQPPAADLLGAAGSTSGGNTTPVGGPPS
jgi:hypothetical protein